MIAPPEPGKNKKSEMTTMTTTTKMKCVLIDGFQRVPLADALLRCGADLGVAKPSEQGPLHGNGFGILAKALGIVEELLVVMLELGRLPVARL